MSRAATPPRPLRMIRVCFHPDFFTLLFCTSLTPPSSSPSVLFLAYTNPPCSHCAPALPSPCPRPPETSFYVCNNGLDRCPSCSRLALLFFSPTARPRLPSTSHTTSLAPTSIRRCASEACMPSSRCSRPAARLPCPSPAPDAVPPRMLRRRWQRTCRATRLR
jgi:hypothetical protein